ncbi:hypothetical protein DFJ58DRAFT_837142 [Suillus subalutaceus]|uniref:uncharacterized protein n=1 Tax=Suillus subalutaceus TaxID=48586 RepID=UPI001B86B6D9|nr:uncharacterized protein DFJ58DRAFT_837142 [Suillus subalutaceus]KAG1871827.1 hypothetical protein DFJ58DRAFT_837142 [Suillus subalutaceus]
MLDILYAEKLCIHDWPTGVPPPGPNFNLKALSASQLHVLVAPYLRIHLGAMYEAKLGLDDDDSEAEAVKAKKCKGNPRSDILALETQATNVCLIPLVIDTDGRVIHSLQDSEKFIKDLPQDDTPGCRTNEVIRMSGPAVVNKFWLGCSGSRKESEEGTPSQGEKAMFQELSGLVLCSKCTTYVVGDVIMEIHQPDDELELHMDFDADFVLQESMVITHAADELESHMDIDADIVAQESTVIAQVADELELHMDFDADIVVHESMVIAKVTDELE